MKKEKKARRSQLGDIWFRFRKNVFAVIGLAIFLIILLTAIFADVIVDYEVALELNPTQILDPPSAEHIFGTDQLGRDLFARIVHGARPSLLIGIGATLISVCIGSLLGGAVGYFGGIFETIIMRIADVIQCIPSMLLLLTIIAVFGKSNSNLMLALTVSLVPSSIRSVRAVVLNVVNTEYIQSAKAYGSTDFRIILRHVLPNAIGPIIIMFTAMISSVILAAASMSYLGFGVEAPNPEWGVMISDAKSVMRTDPYLIMIPGLLMVIVATAINLMGDGLRDALDPRLKD